MQISGEMTLKKMKASGWLNTSAGLFFGGVAPAAQILFWQVKG